MNVHVLTDAPPPWLADALAAFEAQFQYPLGRDASFSISHGREYVTFFAAMGDATVLVVERDGRVLATFATVLRPVRFPDGSQRPAAYLADLKLCPSARGGLALARIFRAMRDHVGDRTAGFGFGVVMDGTGVTPADYSGRLGFPAFTPVARLTLLRIATNRAVADAPINEVTPADLDAAWERLAPRGFVPLGGDSSMRSLQSPVSLVTDDLSACGRVEDTRRGKRLLLASGEELRSAHLSRFAFATPRDGVRLIRQALSFCARHGVPALFVGLPRDTAPAFLPLLSDLEIAQANATVHACGHDSSGDWWVDTAEI